MILLKYIINFLLVFLVSRRLEHLTFAKLETKDPIYFWLSVFIYFLVILFAVIVAFEDYYRGFHKRTGNSRKRFLRNGMCWFSIAAALIIPYFMILFTISTRILLDKRFQLIYKPIPQEKDEELET